MTGLRKGIALAAIQILLVTVVGAKLAIDRARYPEVWVETAPYDPFDPLRGRYVRFQIMVGADLPVPGPDSVFQFDGRLEIVQDHLMAIPEEGGPLTFDYSGCGADRCLVLDRPLAFFISEHVDDPSIRQEGETLWARVTVPPGGPPRPVELGVKKGDGPIEPLDV